MIQAGSAHEENRLYLIRLIRTFCGDKGLLYEEFHLWPAKRKAEGLEVRSDTGRETTAPVKKLAVLRGQSNLWANCLQNGCLSTHHQVLRGPRNPWRFRVNKARRQLALRAH